MATIYFHYHELLRQSADQAVRNGRENHPNDNDDQQQDAPTNKLAKKEELKTTKDEDQASKSPSSIQADTEATLAALQPRMNRLAYLQTAGATNLEALARSLGPKL